jgi:hypothetical protein
VLTRHPDLIIHTAMNIRILEPGEEPPEARAQELNGVIVAFSSVKEENDETVSNQGRGRNRRVRGPSLRARGRCDAREAASHHSQWHLRLRHEFHQMS